MSHPDMRDVILLYQKQIGLLSSSQRDQLYKFLRKACLLCVRMCYPQSEGTKTKKQTNFV